MNLKEEIEKIVYSGNEPEIIVDRLIKLVEGNYVLDKKGKDSLKKAVTVDVEKWIDEWLNLFPVGVKSGSKLVRSDRNMCLKKMVDVVMNSPYYKETIMEATKQYVESFRKDNYMFMKCATYFISKEREGSELIAMCDKITLTKEKGIHVTEITESEHFV